MRDHEYKRHGTLTLMAGIDLLTGHVHALQYLERCGADLIIMGELEIARRMAERALGPQAATPESDREPVRP